MVYLAKDLSFGERLVAVKEMSQSHLQEDEMADAADAFQREAMLLSKLRHNNLPHVYAHFEDSGRWYLVMDFGLQLCTVLDYLHKRHPPVIFRDLKPANIMQEAETIYLIDFDIARHF